MEGGFDGCDDCVKGNGLVGDWGVEFVEVGGEVRGSFVVVGFF